MATVTLPDDGAVKTRFKSPTGAALELVGHAKTKDLEIVNQSSDCRWKLTPE
jgi:hypothetical protein